jgi:hypothetical protein
MPSEVDRTSGVLVCEPVRRDAIGHRSVADLVAVLVAFYRLANFARPKHALRIPFENKMHANIETSSVVRQKIELLHGRIKGRISFRGG